MAVKADGSQKNGRIAEAMRPLSFPVLEQFGAVLLCGKRKIGRRFALGRDGHFYFLST